MNTIRLIEENFSDGKGEIAQATSSFHPLNEPLNVSHISANPRDNEGERPAPSGHFLPCHYFDFICGSSTGGYAKVFQSNSFRELIESQSHCYHALAPTNDCRRLHLGIRDFSWKGIREPASVSLDVCAHMVAQASEI